MFVKGGIGMSRNKKYIIITGQIASGKSSISEKEIFLKLNLEEQYF